MRLRPSKIEVWRTADEGAIDQNYPEEVGIEMEDLVLKLFDESGKELQLPVRCSRLIAYMLVPQPRVLRNS